jgi:hypothetical protein
MRHGCFCGIPLRILWKFWLPALAKEEDHTGKVVANFLNVRAIATTFAANSPPLDQSLLKFTFDKSAFLYSGSFCHLAPICLRETI